MTDLELITSVAIAVVVACVFAAFVWTVLPSEQKMMTVDGR
jgi:hypothetical protein